MAEVGAEDEIITTIIKMKGAASGTIKTYLRGSSHRLAIIVQRLKTT